MHLSGLRSAALSAVLLAAASGCGGSSGSGTSKISVHLMDAPGEYDQVNIDVQEIQINGPQGWQSLGTVDKVINLLDLTNGVTTTLVNEFGIEAGHYTQLRMILGANNTVLPKGATTPVPLKVPSGMQSGIKLNVTFDVAPGTTKDVFIDFNAARSVFVHQAGNSGQYILRPVVFGYAEVVTGSLSGTVTDATTHQPIAGAEVSIQQVGTDGLPSLIRATDTDANGHYVFDHVWVGQPYYLVSQPVIGTTVYETYAALAPAITTAAPIQTADFSLTATTAFGGISGGISPVAGTDVFDEAILLQSFTLGGNSVMLQLHTTQGAVSGTTETYGFANLPAGAYSVYDYRTVGNPATASGAGAQVAATVTAGTTTANVNLVAPTLP